MQHTFPLNTHSLRRLAVFVTVAAALVLAVVPASAQGSTYPVNTITVSGYGEANAAPDAASVDIGIEIVGENVPSAFAEANTILRRIVEAVSALGIAAEDIRTSNLSIYGDSGFGGGMEMMSVRQFRVSNTVNIVVRDISKIEAVLDAAIAAGATNVYGLNFILSNPSAVEQEARVAAMADARARAEQLAAIVGAQLGDAIIISEGGLSGVFPQARGFDMAMGSGGAFVSPGQSSVSVSVQVTYTLTR